MTPVHCGLVLVVGSWPDLGSRRLKLPMARVQGSGPQGGARVEPPNGLHSRHREVVAGCPEHKSRKLLLPKLGDDRTRRWLRYDLPSSSLWPAAGFDRIRRRLGYDLASRRGVEWRTSAADEAWGQPDPAAARGRPRVLRRPDAIWSGTVETGGRERSEEWGGGVG